MSPDEEAAFRQFMAVAEPRLFRALVGGQTWTVHSTPLGPSKVCTQDVGVAALNATDWWLLCLGQSAAGSSTGALFHTLNGGGRWTTVNAVTNLAAPHNTLPLGDPGAFGVGSGGKLWLTNQAGMMESADGGITWEVAKGIDTEGGGSLQVTFDVFFRNFVWFLVPGGGLWVTTQGVNWKRLAATFDG